MLQLGRTMPAVVLDIEGTTTPISFVYDVLFPYARQHAQAYLKAHWGEAELVPCIEAFREQSRQDLAAGLPVQPVPLAGEADAEVTRQAVAANVRTYMEADRKVTCLKTLQGLVWRDGYDEGELQGVVFDDVPGALRRWHEGGTAVYIYSSGSIEAQQLLFRYSNHGDLSGCLSGYFDTTTGPKRDSDSYRKIAASVGLPPADMLFATDVLAEAEAAHAAGFKVVLLKRPGNAPLAPHAYPEAEDLTRL